MINYIDLNKLWLVQGQEQPNIEMTIEEIVEPGQLAPDEIHCPGIFVKRVVKGERFEHRLENIRKDNVQWPWIVVSVSRTF